MSDDIPFEIQIEIIKLLPLKSLIQFRSVSKPWKSVIDSSGFIADYTARNHAQPHHLLVRYGSLYYENDVYVSITDNDSFPLNKNSPNVPPSVNRLRDSIIVGASRGLVCLFGYYRNPGDVKYYSGTATAVVWNPLIRKSVAITVPNVYRSDVTAFGFGVCPATIDPKIVKISNGETGSGIWKVEVFSLSSGVWRSLSCNPFDKMVDFNYPHTQVIIDGFIYWFGIGAEFLLILSFDLSNEVFKEIYLPDELAFHDGLDLFLFNLRDSLVVLKEWILDGEFEVWMMENGDSKSFTKVFTINKQKPYVYGVPLGFSWNGELMMSVTDNNEDSETLIACEPFSEHVNDLEIEAECYTLLVSSYTESLVLLDQLHTFDDGEDDEEMSV